jgi:hypothetical protein
MNEARAQIYARLMDAQEQIAQRLYRRGVSNEVVQEALDAVDERISESERREDLYLAALTHYVAALGGRVEVRAVFDDDEILISSREQDSAPPFGSDT